MGSLYERTKGRELMTRANEMPWTREDVERLVEAARELVPDKDFIEAVVTLDDLLALKEALKPFQQGREDG